MHGWKRLLILALGLIIVNAVTWAVLTENLHYNRYPVHGNKIIIPIFTTLLLSFFVVPLLLAICLLPGTEFLNRLYSRGRIWSICVNLLLLTFYAISSLFAVFGAAYWSLPNHYSIMNCYFVLLAALSLFFVLDVKRLFTQWSINKRTRATS